MIIPSRCRIPDEAAEQESIEFENTTMEATKQLKNKMRATEMADHWSCGMLRVSLLRLKKSDYF